MPDWRALAQARNFPLTGPEIDKAAASLDALEALFRPLVPGIPDDTEPAITLSEPAVTGQ